jgi:hypothetical protein
MDRRFKPHDGAASRRDDVLLKAIFLGAVSFAVYLLTRTRHFGGDDTVFALVVQRWLELGAVEPEFVHPHHMLYNPLVAVWSWIVDAVTGSVFVLDAGATVSSAAAAAMVAGLYVVLRRWAVADGTAVLASVILAVAGGVWRCATQMEVYTLAGLGVVLWLAAVSDDRASWRKLAVGLAAPWIGHLALSLLVLPTIWLNRRRPKTVAAAVLVGAVIPGVVMATLLAAIHRPTSLPGFTSIFASPELMRWLSPPDLPGALQALMGVAVWAKFRTVPVFPESVVTTFAVLGSAAAAVLAALAALGVVEAWRGRSRLAVVAGLGVASLTPLWLLWDTGNTEHAVAAAPLLATLIAVGATSLDGRIATPAMVFAGAAMLVVNGVGSAMLGTQAHFSRTLRIADHVRTHLSESATLLSIGVDPELRLSLPYLSGRRVVSLSLLVRSARHAGASADEALERWLEIAVDAPDPWVLEDLDDPAVATMLDDLDVTADMWRVARRFFSTIGSATLPADEVVILEPVTLHRVRVAPPSSSRFEPAVRLLDDGRSEP